MADVKISGLTAASARVKGEDLRAASIDPSGTPLSRKTTLHQQGVFFRGYIDGLEILNGTGDIIHDITIGLGVCRDSTNTVWIDNIATITKQIDATWAEGDDAGGLFTGSVAADTWYHFFIIMKTDGTIDGGFDTSVSAANLPAGYTYFRRLGSVLTDGSSNIIRFHQYGDHFIWDQSVEDHDNTLLGATAANFALTVAPDVIVDTDCMILAFKSGARAWFFSPSQADNTTTTASWCSIAYDGRQALPSRIRTDTNGQIRGIGNTSGISVYIVTIGWWDKRGRV